MRRKRAVLVILFSAAILASCTRQPPGEGKTPEVPALPEKTWRVFVVMDTVDDWSGGIRDGFTEKLDSILSSAGSRAAYEILDTGLSPDTAESIRARIETEKPDLVCTVNYPSGFADSMITAKLKGVEYRFVSENPVPVETGIIGSWASPGGNVTGVGVFVQLNSALRLIRKVMPERTKVYSSSWDAMKDINAWWEAELRKACAEEHFELVEFARLKSSREETAFNERVSVIGKDAVIFSCISVYVDDDGNPVDANSIVTNLLRTRQIVPWIAYEDTTVKAGALLGACVVWRDVGAQLAEKAARILSGENPGSIPWDYPRTFNVIINRKTAERLGIVIPSEIVNSAYRIYTDYEGTFAGKGD